MSDTFKVDFVAENGGEVMSAMIGGTVFVPADRLKKAEARIEALEKERRKVLSIVRNGKEFGWCSFETDCLEDLLLEAEK